MKKSDKLPSHYDSIYFLPVLNWKLIHDESDFSYLLNKRMPINDAQKAKLLIVWNELKNQFNSVFGFGENFKNICEKKLKVISLNAKMILTGDQSIQTLVDIETLKIKALSENKGSDIAELKKIIEKRIGIRVPLAETSVYEFYTYLKDLK